MYQRAVNRQADGMIKFGECNFVTFTTIPRVLQWRSSDGTRVGSLPLIFARGFMKDVLLAVNSENTVFQDALPADELAQQEENIGRDTNHLFLTR